MLLPHMSGRSTTAKVTLWWVWLAAFGVAPQLW